MARKKKNEGQRNHKPSLTGRCINPVRLEVYQHLIEEPLAYDEYDLPVVLYSGVTPIPVYVNNKYYIDPEGKDRGALDVIVAGEKYDIIQVYYECEFVNPKTGKPWERYIWAGAEPFTGLTNRVAKTKQLQKLYKRFLKS